MLSPINSSRAAGRLGLNASIALKTVAAKHAKVPKHTRMKWEWECVSPLSKFPVFFKRTSDVEKEKAIIKAIKIKASKSTIKFTANVPNLKRYLKNDLLWPHRGCQKAKMMWTAVQTSRMPVSKAARKSTTNGQVPSGGPKLQFQQKSPPLPSATRWRRTRTSTGKKQTSEMIVAKVETVNNARALQL